MPTFITEKQKVSLYVNPIDAADNPTKVTEVLWESSDPTKVEVVRSPDKQSAQARAVAIGTATVTATMGSITNTIDVEVIAPDAVSLTVLAGTPSPL